MERMVGLVRRCVDDYNMISPGETVAVGVSGGKDSLVLLCALRHLHRYYPASFELEALTVDTGFPGMDFSGVQSLCDELGVHYTLLKTDIRRSFSTYGRRRTPAPSAPKCAGAL